jgi:hypothetical protein
MLNNVKIIKKEIQSKKIKLLVWVLFILLVSCVGSQQSMGDKTNKEHSTEESTRDRTPSAPRINVPAHTF